MNKKNIVLYLLIFPIFFVNFANSNISTTKSKFHTKNQALNEVFKLMLQSFLGAKDLKNALKVVQDAISKFPKNSYWWNKYIQILIWSGNYPEALKVALEAYKSTNNRKFLIKAFNLAWALRRWDLAVNLLDKYKLDIPFKKRVALYYNAGRIFKLIEALEQKKDKYSLEQLIYIYYALGELNKALYYANLALKKYKNSLKFITLKAEILIAQKKFYKAYNLLRKYQSLAKNKNTDFWKLLSDVSWLIGDYKTSTLASLKLIKTGKAREEDFYRVLFSGEDVPNYINIALKAWRFTRKKEFLIAAINYAYSKNNWSILKNLFQKYTFLKKRKDIFYIYVETLLHIGNKQLAYKILEDNLNKFFSKDLFNLYITHLIRERKLKQLEAALQKFKRYQCKASYTFIYAYLASQNGQKAWKVYTTCGVNKPILKADILYLLGKKRESNFIKYKVFLTLLGKLKQEPSIFKNQDFLNDFLYVSINFLPRSTYEKLLFKARKFLPPEVWRNLYLNFLFKESEYQLINYLVNIQGFHLEPWMELSLYSYERNLLKLDKTLRKYKGFLPYSDTINALNTLKRYKQAYWYAYEGLKKNPFNYDIYTQFVDTISQISNYITTSLQVSFQEGYGELNLNSELFYRNFLKGYNITTQLSVYSPTYSSKETVIAPPRVIWVLSSLEKSYNHFKLQLYFSLLKNLQTNLGGGFKISLLPLSKFQLNLEGFYNYHSTDTLYLHLGGIKDYTQLSLTYKPLPRINLNMSLTENIFYSTDRKYLGYQLLSEISLLYRYRISFPKINFKFYMQNSKAHTTNNKGSIKDILPDIGTITVPQTYNSFGGEFIFGEEIGTFSGRKWKPFASLGLSYNNRYGTLSSLTLGVNRGIFYNNRGNIVLKFHIEKNPIKNQGTYMNFNIGYNYNF